MKLAEFMNSKPGIIEGQLYTYWKKITHKWAYTVQTSAVQKSAVYGSK